MSDHQGRIQEFGRGGGEGLAFFSFPFTNVWNDI